MSDEPQDLGEPGCTEDEPMAPSRDTGHSVLELIERLSGTRSRILLRDAPEDGSPVLRLTPAGDEAPLTDDVRYQVLGEIGRGGMGTVYKGRDKDLGRDVALKVLRNDLAKDAAVLQRFVEEAQVGGQLQHPGVVPIYGIGLQEAGRPYFAMKLVKGETLASLLEGGVEASELIRVFERVAQTVAYAHSRGVIHRDLKPSNVMVGAFGEVHVVDWGFAKVLGREEPTRRPGETVVATVRTRGEGSQSIAGSVMGTPGYMPPEQAMGSTEELTERADVFSLGAILCELLTRQPPYTGTVQDQLIAAMRAKLDEAYARIDACDAPEPLKQLARACLEPVPKDRPKDAGVVAQHVADHLASVEERARKAEIDAVHAAAEGRRVQRGRRTMLTLAAVALVAIVGGGAGLYAWRSAEHARVGAANAKVAPLLRDATRLEGERDWAAATAAAGTALALAETEGADAETLATARELSARIETAAAADRALAEKQARETRLLDDLDEQAMQKADLSAQDQEAGYRAAFATFGVDPDAQDAATRLAAFGNPADLAIHLDGWVQLRREAKDERWQDLDRLVRTLDGDPWRTRLRDASAAGDLEALRALASEDESASQRTTTLAALAEVLRNAGDADAGVALLRRAVALHPGDFYVHHGLAKLLWWDLRSPFEAMAHAEAAVAVRPQSAGAWSVIGAIRIDGQRDKEGAHRAFRNALAVAPGSVLAHANLALVLRQLGDMKGALAEAREAIRLDPQRALGHIQLAQVLREKGDIDAALAAVREALRVDPTSGAPHAALAAVRQTQGDLDGAIEAMREAVRLEPKSASYHGRLSTGLLNKHDLDGALAEIREAIKIAPRYPALHLHLGLLLVEMGDGDGAVAAFREGLRLDPTSAEAFSSVGAVLCDRLGRYDAALFHFREAMRIDPDFFPPHPNIGIALFKRGDYAAADEALEQAAAMDSSVRQKLGRMMADAKRFAAARARIPAVLRGEGRPTRAADWLMLADVCWRTSDMPAVVRFYQEAFAADPRTVADPLGPLRYRAAGAAVLSGPRWYPQALLWLASDLDALEALPPSAAKQVADALRRWKAQPDFAVVRDGPDVPAKWLALWQRVDALFVRANEAAK